MSTQPRNMFIAVEGGEGCGKSTFCKLFTEELKKLGYSVVLTREPGGTDFGETIRQTIMDNPNLDSMTEAALFCAARNGL